MESLSTFTAPKRRFEVVGCANGVTIVDDYAHNPAKLRAALLAAKTGGKKRVVAVYQPHRYSRTNFLLQELSESFYEADVLYVTDVYSAGEEPIPGADSSALVNLIKKKNHTTSVYYVPDMKNVVTCLDAELCNDDLLITLGAGDITKLSYDYLGHLKSKRNLPMKVECPVK